MQESFHELNKWLFSEKKLYYMFYYFYWKLRRHDLNNLSYMD